eukprot:4265797-Prorocentrum_lima.AAC.1
MVNIRPTKTLVRDDSPVRVSLSVLRLRKRSSFDYSGSSGVCAFREALRSPPNAHGRRMRAVSFCFRQ